MAERPRHPALEGEQGRRARPLTLAEIKARQSPLYPKPYDVAVAAAIKGLSAGTATADQQRLAITWIIRTLCGTYDVSYRPGADGERDTAFAEGMRNAGLQLVRLVNIDLSKITSDGEPREHG